MKSKVLILFFLVIGNAASAQFCHAICNSKPCSNPASISGPSSLCSGNTITLTDATSSGVWSSAITTTAAVGSASGIVTGVSAGTSNISYTVLGGCYAWTTITVNTTPASITGTVSCASGSTSQLTDATGGGVWSSSTTTVATIGTAGLVSGVSSGTSTISYTLGSCAVSAVFTVTTSTVYATFTSLHAGPNVTLTSGNLDYANATGTNNCAYATIGTSTGISSGSAFPNVYWETHLNSASTVTVMGAAPASLSTGNYLAASGNPGYGFVISFNASSGYAYTNGGGGTGIGGCGISNDYAFCLNMQYGYLYIGQICGGTITWFYSGNPLSGAAGTGAINTAASGLSGTSTLTGTWFPAQGYNNDNITYNFGPTFLAAKPTGYTGVHN